MKILEIGKVVLKTITVIIIILGVWVIYRLGFSGPIPALAFVDFPAEVKEIKINSIDWNNAKNKKFTTYQTAINEAVKTQKINLAGKYTAVVVGCGTACSHAYFVNRETGTITDSKITATNGFEYRKDSTLFVMNPVDQVYKTYGDQVPEDVLTQYYVLEDGVLKILNP
ncbi:MAG: hypothetical protein QM526_01495 [Alphaproteobacteria bacterium]|nr:hypothetical protein [Alphaproteobacteria bacterium]